MAYSAVREKKKTIHRSDYSKNLKTQQLALYSIDLPIGLSMAVQLAIRSTLRWRRRRWDRAKRTPLLGYSLDSILLCVIIIVSTAFLFFVVILLLVVALCHFLVLL
jgi:hypothetical protein